VLRRLEEEDGRLIVLLKLDLLEPTGLRWIWYVLEEIESVLEDDLMRACAGNSSPAGRVLHSHSVKSGSGERRPLST
jgi:hypothetical protein